MSIKKLSIFERVNCGPSRRVLNDQKNAFIVIFASSISLSLPFNILSSDLTQNLLQPLTLIVDLFSNWKEKTLAQTTYFIFRHGKGKMTFVSGVVYEGQWQYDEMTGYGTLKCPDGTIQEGNWKDGSLNGCVLFTWPHGVTEYREYKQGQG